MVTDGCLGGAPPWGLSCFDEIALSTATWRTSGKNDIDENFEALIRGDGAEQTREKSRLQPQLERPAAVDATPLLALHARVL
jgi:hypothetical protein